MDFQNLKQKIKDFIVKLQGLDEKQKKIIMWTIVGILGIIMGIFWIKSTLYKIENMGEINLNLPQFENIEIKNTEVQTDFTNWQTYTNEEYGFEIKYPKDWTPREGYGLGMMFTTQERQSNEEDPVILYFSKLEKDKNNFDSNDLINGSSQAKFNEINWIRFEPMAYLFEIHYRTTNSSEEGFNFAVYREEDEKTLIQILSTFKFIK